MQYCTVYPVQSTHLSLYFLLFCYFVYYTTVYFLKPLNLYSPNLCLSFHLSVVYRIFCRTISVVLLYSIFKSDYLVLLCCRFLSACRIFCTVNLTIHLTLQYALYFVKTFKTESTFSSKFNTA